MVARRYQFYVRVAKTISHEWAKRTGEILFLPRFTFFSLCCTNKNYGIEPKAQTSSKSYVNPCSSAVGISFKNISLFFYFVRNSLSGFKLYEVSFFVPAFSCSLLNNFSRLKWIYFYIARHPAFGNVFNLALQWCEMTSSISSHERIFKVRDHDLIPDVVSYEFYEWCIYQ